ncbi:F0F1 ATP synthase subunit epsilon [Desulfovibrio inopinatus]|uniref:F0F1 ATP synthase subunit epsilon n=1 Tax=Desulfovibrio inopinatus TaxID=102109 RepID=UPI0004078E40|nr:F0F1 ATP synthase subunit epsilon [Desulfovibrio inopinatus]
MAKDLRLEVVTPDRLVLSQEVEYVGAPGIEGEFGIMPNHIPFLSALGVGSLYYKLDGKYYYVFVAGGFAEVSSNKVTILAEIAEKAEDIDLERARRAEQRARERMQKAEDNIAQARAQAALQRAMQRMTCRSTASSAGTCSL